MAKKSAKTKHGDVLPLSVAAIIPQSDFDDELLDEVRQEMIDNKKVSQIAREHGWEASYTVRLTDAAMDHVSLEDAYKLSFLRFANAEGKLSERIAAGDANAAMMATYVQTIKDHIKTMNDSLTTQSSVLTRLNANQVREMVLIIQEAVWPVLEGHLDGEECDDAKQQTIENLKAQAKQVPDA
jgi:hypothetical protein